MIVTDIIRQKRGLYDIECDGEIIGQLDRATINRLGIAPGREVDAGELLEAAEALARKNALDRALGMVARREVCRKMVTAKLAPEYGEQIASDTADRLEQLGLLSDRRYAEMLAENLYFVRRFYYRRVCFELRAKGIDPELAEQVAAELAPDEHEALRELLEHSRSFDLSDEKSRRRAFAALTRYGYSSSAISRALRSDDYWE